MASPGHPTNKRGEENFVNMLNFAAKEEKVKKQKQQGRTATQLSFP